MAMEGGAKQTPIPFYVLWSGSLRVGLGARAQWNPAGWRAIRSHHGVVFFIPPVALRI